MHPSTEPAQIQELSTPWPPRYRWLKRSLVIFATVASLLIVLHFWWNRTADRRLAAVIAAIHARGEPILPEDFPAINIPDSDNAAWYLRQAAAAIKHGPEAEMLWNGWGIAYTAHEISDLTRWMDDEKTTRSMARNARAHPTVAWNVQFGSPAMMTGLPDLNTARSLANKLEIMVFVQHRRGDDAESVETIRDINFVANAMQQYLPTVISHLVGVGIGAITSDAAINLSPDLTIADESSATRPGASPASRAQVLQLVADLSDERQYRLGGIRSLYGERWVSLDAIKLYPRQLVPDPVAYMLVPASKLDVINILQAEAQVSRAMGQPTLAAARALMPNIQPMRNRRGLSMWTHMLSSILMPSFDRFVVTHFRGLTDRRAAVIALAIRLWRFDHAGKWPATLEELTPKYLATAPVDPMSLTAAPFHYKPDAPGGAIIYSVGEGGVDFGGSEQLIRKTQNGYTPSRWDELNAVYHLTPQPPTTLPASD
jgi:hypothetical protein